MQFPGAKGPELVFVAARRTPDPKDVHLSSSLRSSGVLVQHLEELFDPVPRAAVHSVKDPHGSYLNQCRCAQHIKDNCSISSTVLIHRCAAYQPG